MAGLFGAAKALATLARDGVGDADFALVEVSLCEQHPIVGVFWQLAWQREDRDARSVAEVGDQAVYATAELFDRHVIDADRARDLGKPVPDFLKFAACPTQGFIGVVKPSVDARAVLSQVRRRVFGFSPQSLKPLALDLKLGSLGALVFLDEVNTRFGGVEPQQGAAAQRHDHRARHRRQT